MKLAVIVALLFAAALAAVWVIKTISAHTTFVGVTPSEPVAPLISPDSGWE